jgi:TAG lipase/steryl ester hydrolase/phospholipase A2/LPA acyltransferase
MRTIQKRAVKTNLALQLLSGSIKINIFKLLIKSLLILSFPIKFILDLVFSDRLLHIYAVISILFLIRSHASKITVLYKIFDKRYRTLWLLRRQISKSITAEEWKQLAMEYEVKNKEFFGPLRWLNINNIYDKELLKKKLEQLNKNRSNENIYDFMNTLRLDLTRNFGNIAKNKLHEHFLFMPNTILKYVQEVKHQLNTVLQSKEIDIKDKITFFRETRHSYGRTALLLSGGASLGSFHMGVVKALFDHGLLPRIIAGSSVGSIVAAIISVRTDEELIETYKHLDKVDLSFFSEHKTIELVRNFIERGYAHDDKFMIDKLRLVLGDYTFHEAYERTGRILNVSVCPVETNEPARVLNYLTSPNVLIWSAVAASSAFPGLFPSQNIYTKSCHGDLSYIPKEEIIDTYGRKWQDGSIELDLPVTTLTEMFNCNYYIVSQCNPHLISILNMKKFVSSNVGQIIEAEFKTRCQQLQWILPKFIPTRWLKFFTQRWEGDVTIVLPITFFDPRKIITNPDVKEILSSVKVGEGKTWENLWAIECNCAIEIYLDKIVKDLCGGKISWGSSSNTHLDKIIERYNKHGSSDILFDIPLECCTGHLSKNPSATDLVDYNQMSLDFIDP